MFEMLKGLILGLVFGPILLQGVSAGCVLNLDSPRPQVVNNFGSKYLVTESKPILQREAGESVYLFCSNGFNLHQNYHGSQTFNNHQIKLTCNYDDSWNFLNTEINSNQGLPNINCLGNQVSEMYESRSPMKDCAKHMSLVVGQSFGDLGSVKSVAMCYDIIQQQLKYVSYTAYPSKLKVIEQTQVGQLNRLGLDIYVAYTRSLFREVSALDIAEKFRKDTQLNMLFGAETYEYTGLIQDEAFASDLLNFKEMLGIVWLRGLRTGNWRHLLNAMHMASLAAKYDVNVGVSGIVTLPTLQSCNETRRLTIELDSGDTLPVPAHIWAHIRAVEPTVNGTDEFVVIAHNSPFFTSSDRDGLCRSMCEEVDWLKNSMFFKLRHYPAYGLVQCCHVLDVENKLDNFPKNIVQSTFIEPVQISEEPIEESIAIPVYNSFEE
ncbi:uncharacterized protein LOC6569176 [Drosophila grimshawi]|uniref:uncharacterized protein LOC6569176 n=1 Tax=Drosophila grimshawi TaxID=7222 RepID=UPI000C87001A|nr:uncharacterized protein LOC6569176 [Drosophila grimshawi]